MEASRRRIAALNDEAVSRRHKPDYWLAVLTTLLLAIGLVVVYSISPGLSASQNVSQGHFVSKQLLEVGAGIAAFFFASFIPADVLKRSVKPAAGAAVILSLLVMLTPLDEVYRAHRWVRFGGLSFQVAELIKLALLISVAKFLSQRWILNQTSDFNLTLKPLLILLGGLGVVVAYLQSDLGSTGVMVAMITLMAFVAGVPLRKIAVIAGIVALMLIITISSSSYRRERLSTFLHPQQDCQSTGYQACQALISIGSGGPLGLGLGYSVQAYGYTPEASNDSIFAIMAEQFGFIGSVIIIVIYGFFIARLKRIANHTSDHFYRLVVVGVMAWLSSQMIINVGAMIGLLPLKGITLPLISQGGTSLVFLTAALGMVFHISRYTSYSVTEPKIAANESPSINYTLNRGRVRRPHNPALVTRPRN